MYDQAKWWNIIRLPRSLDLCSEGKRLLFYWYVLKWQLNDRNLKRVCISNEVFKIFCGEKKLKIADEEAKIILWAFDLKGDNKNGKKRFDGHRECRGII